MDKPWLKSYDPGVPAHIDYPDVPLHAFLEDAARKHPNKTATVFFNARLTYRQLDALANRVAAALRAGGLKKGERVGLILPNCPQFVASYYGVLKAGGVVVANNPLYTASLSWYSSSRAV